MPLLNIYSDPPILRPPMGPRKCGLILQVVLNQRSFNTLRKLPFGTKSSDFIIKGGLKIEGCEIEGLLYLVRMRAVGLILVAEVPVR